MIKKIYLRKKLVVENMQYLGYFPYLSPSGPEEMIAGIEAVNSVC